MQILEVSRTLENKAQEHQAVPQAVPLPAEGSPGLPIAGTPGGFGDFIDADLGWREFLRTVGVSAAIVSYVRDSGDVGRQAFIVGFDGIRSDLRMIRALVSYAERIWQVSGTSVFLPFRTCDGGHEAMRGADCIQPAASAAVRQLLEPFDHAAVARRSELGVNLQALLFRRSSDGEFTKESRESIVRVLPLLLQSAGACVAARREQRRTAQLEAMFDKVSLATLLVDADARPIFCNDAARTMLNERKWLLQSPDGTLACRNAALTRELKVAIRGVATIGDFASTDTVLRLDSEEGEWRLAFVVPAVSRFRDESSRCAMLLIHAPARTVASAQMLSALGLLPSEQRFLTSFLRAASLSEAALETGVSDETARTYLKRVRAKLGVHRQMDLAGLISGLVPPIRRRPTSAG